MYFMEPVNHTFKQSSRFASKSAGVNMDDHEDRQQKSGNHMNQVTKQNTAYSKNLPDNELRR